MKLYRLALLNAEDLKKAKMQTELDALRQQVNPHFLFNSLNSLTLVTHVLPGTGDRRLPPLTLQLLIENAVKHNVILPEQPLTIALTTNEQHFVVSNNLQRKPSRAFSNGVGLTGPPVRQHSNQVPDAGSTCSAH